MFLSKYGVARHIYIPVVKRAVVDFAVSADWTPAAGDVKISKDGGAAANVTNLPTAITMGNGAYWDFSLTATEMQAAQVVVTVADSATKAVEDQSFIIETYGNASSQHPFDLATALQAVNVTQFGGNAGTFSSGVPEVNSTKFAGQAITAAAGVTLPSSVASPTNITQATGVDVTKWNGTTVATPDTAGYVKATIKAGTGTGEINLSSGAVPVKGNVKKNTALATFMFMMTDSTGHAPATGKTVTCSRSIDGAAFASGTLANVIEVGNGIYAVDFASGDLNGNNIILRATATGCDDAFERICTFVA